LARWTGIDEDACIINERIEATEITIDLLCSRIDRFLIRDIEHDWTDVEAVGSLFVGSLSTTSRITGSEQDDHAVPSGELASNFQTNALIGAGDERDATMSLRIGHVSSWLIDARADFTSSQIP
jgi:hypothetical protein